LEIGVFEYLNKFSCSITFDTYKFSIKIRSSSLKPMFTPNRRLLPGAVS